MEWILLLCIKHVYSRIFQGKGSVRMLTLTEKQYESIDVLLGTKTFDDASESVELINIF